MKEIITFISILILGVLYNKEKIKAFYFVVFTIPFPVYIQFMGRDAITLTTLLIFVLFFIDILSNKNTKKTIPSILKILLFFIFSNTMISSLFVFRIEQIRYLLGFASGILLFYLAIKLITDKQKFKTFIEILAIGVVINIFISILQILNINFTFFDFFATRNSAELSFIYSKLSYLRPAGFVRDYELFSEWIVLLFPWVFVLYQETKKKWILFLLIMLPIGTIITVTRSSLILFIISLVLLVVLIRRVNQKGKFGFILALVLIVCISFFTVDFFFPEYIRIFNDRIISINYDNMSDIGLIINREGRWEAFYSHKVTLLGYGELSDWSGFFHSLYYTIIYKDGLIGIILFSLFILYLTKNIFHSIEIKEYRLISLMVIVMFLINEIKIEYLRQSLTIQFAWLIFSTPIIISKIGKPKSE